MQQIITNTTAATLQSAAASLLSASTTATPTVVSITEARPRAVEPNKTAVEPAPSEQSTATVVHIYEPVIDLDTSNAGYNIDDPWRDSDDDMRYLELTGNVELETKTESSPMDVPPHHNTAPASPAIV